MSHPETAGAFLRESLPPEVSQQLTPDSPQLIEGTFIEERLRPYFADRLFQTKTVDDKELFLYILLEHKSYEDKKVGWQLFRGISAFMEQKNRENEQWQKLPAILPLLLYHGKQKWRIANEFMALIDANEALRPWLINFRYPVIDLGPIPDDQLSQHARLKAGLLALKYGTRTPQEQMEALENITVALIDAPELLLPIMLYMLTTFQNLNETQVRQVIRRINPLEEATMISQFAQEILAKGKPEWATMVRQEGRQEGWQEGETTILMRQLQRRFGTLPDWVHKKITTAQPDALAEWSLRILDAQSLETVFTDPE